MSNVLIVKGDISEFHVCLFNRQRMHHLLSQLVSDLDRLTSFYLKNFLDVYTIWVVESGAQEGG